MFLCSVLEALCLNGRCGTGNAWISEPFPLRRDDISDGGSSFGLLPFSPDEARAFFFPQFLLPPSSLLIAMVTHD